MLGLMRRAISNLLAVDRSNSATAESNLLSSELQADAVAAGTSLVDAESIPGLQRQQRLIDLYLFVLDWCLRNGAAQWWRQAVSLPFADSAQGLEHLKNLCLNELLYAAGDVATFCKVYEILEEDGHLEVDDDAKYLLDLLRFVRPMLKTEQPRSSGNGLARYFAPRRPQKRLAVVSVIVPDESASSRFLDLCLPSLESEGGLKSLLSERIVTLQLFVCAQRVSEIEGYLRQKELDCTISCQPIPEGLCGESHIVAGGIKRDWLIGSLQYLHLLQAKRLNADFFAINPQAAYGSGFFRNLMRAAADKPAVLSAGLWINNQGLLDRKSVRDPHDGSLAISAVDLATMGLDVSAPGPCTTFVEGFVSTRGATAQLRVTWVGKDCIELHSTFYDMLFVAREALRKMPDRFFIRPSTEMDRILDPNDVPYFVKEDDGIVVAEFGHPPGSFCEIKGEGAGFEAVVDHIARHRQAEFFRRPVRVAIPRSDGQETSGLATAPSPPLRNIFVGLAERAGAPARPSTDQVLSALNVLHHYETSEYGLENMARTIEEGGRLIDICPSTERDLNESERKVLIRAAMNFDHVGKAIALAKAGREGTSFIHEFLVKMMELRAANAARARALRRRFFLGRPFAVIGSIAWGEAFVDKFMNYHVASLLASGNIPALARKRKVIHSIVTTETDRKRIVAHPLFRRLREHAEVVFTCFPEKFLEQRERDQYNFYYFYGLLDHQSVFLASALRGELYLLPVDIVLSRDSLSNLARHLAAGADSCSVAGIECDPSPLGAWLDARSRGAAGELDLPADELLTAAIGMPDAYSRSLFMTPGNQSFCRHPRELIWPMAGGLAIHSIFMHPVAVSARLMSRPFHPQYENVDFALLPRLLQADGRLEVLQDPSEVASAQFGAPAEREEFLESGFSLEAFLEAHQHDYAAQRRCFAIRQFFPCKEVPAAPSINYKSDVALLGAALKRYRFRTEQ